MGANNGPSGNRSYPLHLRSFTSDFASAFQHYRFKARHVSSTSGQIKEIKNIPEVFWLHVILYRWWLKEQGACRDAKGELLATYCLC
jgi:hypothetical protein